MSNISKIMKLLIFTICLLLSFFVTTKAQDSGIFGELIPYTKWLAKIQEKNKGIVCIIDSKPKPEKLNISFGIETKTLQNTETVAVIKMGAKSNELIYLERDGKLISETRFWGRIMSKDKKFDYVFEEIIPVTIEMNQMDKIFPVVFQRFYNLPKNKYTINLFANDVASGWEQRKT